MWGEHSGAGTSRRSFLTIGALAGLGLGEIFRFQSAWASDETIGEMRIHYAGFVHPFFGKDRKDNNPGTPLIFEVRGHQVNVSLADGEKMANLTFFRMSKDCNPSGDDNDEEDDEYNNQNLKLSKFFAKWPPKLKQHPDGSVEPELEDTQ